MEQVFNHSIRTVTILIPCHNESLNVLKLYDELKAVIKNLPNYDFKILFVDDGSKDNTVQILEKLSNKDLSVSLIELSRNFGKEIAITAGLDNVDTEAVIIMDADLQHPPKYIPQFLEEWEKGFDIVATKRIEIKGQPILKRIGSYLFYWILDNVSSVKMMSQTTDFRLLDKIVIEAFQEFREKNRMVRGIIDWMGYKKSVIYFEAPERYAGVAAYGYRKLFALAINGITSFSLFPLKVSGYIGIFITLFFGTLLSYMCVDHFLLGKPTFTPISFVIVVNTIFIGIVLMSLGLIALYIGNIHTEVTGRPLYLVRKKTGKLSFSYIERKKNSQISETQQPN